MDKKLFLVKANYKKEGERSFDFEMHLVPHKEDSIKEDFYNMVYRLEEFDSDIYYDEDDVKSHVNIISIEEVTEIELLTSVGIYAEIPIGYGYRTDKRCDNWEEAYNFLTGSDREFPRFRRMYVEFKDSDLSYEIFYDYRSVNESSRKAIESCVRNGIDPFGY